MFINRINLLVRANLSLCRISNNSAKLISAAVNHFSAYKVLNSSKDTHSPFLFQSLSDISSPKSNGATASSDIKLNYETIAEETLQSLSERFDSLADELSETEAKQYDVEYSSGVLKVKLGSELGTYVLNKQTPNLQIWLSSPISGPKRFDYVNNTWVYKRTNESLHALLSEEISECFKRRIDFATCSYGKEIFTK